MESQGEAVFKRSDLSLGLLPSVLLISSLMASLRSVVKVVGQQAFIQKHMQSNTHKYALTNRDSQYGAHTYCSQLQCFYLWIQLEYECFSLLCSLHVVFLPLCESSFLHPPPTYALCRTEAFEMFNYTTKFCYFPPLDVAEYQTFGVGSYLFFPHSPTKFQRNK